MVTKPVTIEPLTTKHVLTLNTFQYFPNSLVKIEQLLCHWRCKLEDYICLFFFSVRSKGTMGDDSISFEFLSVHSPAYLPYLYASS
jgi:hypothetical protein